MHELVNQNRGEESIFTPRFARQLAKSAADAVLSVLPPQSVEEIVINEINELKKGKVYEVLLHGQGITAQLKLESLTLTIGVLQLIPQSGKLKNKEDKVKKIIGTLEEFALIEGLKNLAIGKEVASLGNFWPDWGFDSNRNEQISYVKDLDQKRQRINMTLNAITEVVGVFWYELLVAQVGNMPRLVNHYLKMFDQEEISPEQVAKIDEEIRRNQEDPRYREMIARMIGSDY